MLVGDRDAPVSPEVADQHERGPDDVVVDQRLAEAGVDRLADDALGRPLLAGQHRVGVRALEVRGAPEVALLAPALLVVVIGDHLTSPRRERSAGAPAPARADGQSPAAAFSRSAQYRAHPAQSILGGIAPRNASAIAGSDVFVRISSSIAAA